MALMLLLRINLSTAKMSETCRAKWKWSCEEPSCPREHWTLTLLSCDTTPKAPWMPIFMDFHWGFTKQAYWLNPWPVVIVLNPSALPSPQRWKKFKPLITPSMTFLITSIIERFSGALLWLVSRPMKDSRFQEFQEAGLMQQDKHQICIIK